MSTFKNAALALAAAGLLSAQAHAGEAQVESLAAAPVAAFSQADVNALFDQSGKSMEIAALSSAEMKETEGAVFWFAPIAAWTIGGGVAGVGINRWQTGSWSGSGRAFGAGATAGFYNSNLAVRALRPAGAFLMGGVGSASWYR